MKFITFAPCPDCDKPLYSDERYEQRRETKENQHPMLSHLPPRGEYCEHYKDGE